MRQIERVTEQSVWDHWRRVEGWSASDGRADIRGPLPTDIVWNLCEVQPRDVDRLFIISSDDWSDVSAGTFRVTAVSSQMDAEIQTAKISVIAGQILTQVEFEDAGGKLDPRLIAVTDSPALLGPFTIIEGNHRAVTFLRRSVLAGSIIFVGYSSKVVDYVWARHTYRSLGE